jgi:protein-tyrosine phosphatase
VQAYAVVDQIPIRNARYPDRERIIRTSNMDLFWINRFRDGNLAIMPAPRINERLEDVILRWRADGIDTVVSLLEAAEIPGLLEAESELCLEFGIEFISFPIRDKTVPPTLEAIASIAHVLAERVSSGQGVAIHCRAGIGRSATLAACVLIWLGVDGEEALDMIAEARGVEVPETEAQRQWVLAFPAAASRLKR